MVSLFAPHFFNWTNLLESSNHQIYWIDVFDSNLKVDKISFANQYIGWKNKIDYPGRYKLKKYFPSLYQMINKINQRDLAKFVEQKIDEIQPDVVQSFVLQTGALPILEVMNKHPKIKWIYSAWGNDLFFRQQNSEDLSNIKKVLPEIDYLFTDCKRDYYVALKHGFKGKFLGAFPGGGGYDISKYEGMMQPFENRKLILIKGYEGKLGRCNKILEAILNIRSQLKEFQIVVFSANQKVIDFIKKEGINEWENFTYHGFLPHVEIMRLMGKSKLYIGNSISDGMPNTLLEAIVMGAYPIQSNPGKVTEEIIIHGNGGLLIENPLDYKEISDLILQAIKEDSQIEKEVLNNFAQIRPQLEREKIKKDVLACYDLIQKKL